MENPYKDALRRLRAKDSHSKVFEPLWSYKSSTEPLRDQLEDEIVEVEGEVSDQAEDTVENLEKNAITEKTKILDSLYQFSDEKLANREEFEFPGGSLSKKDKGARVLSKGSEDISALKKDDILALARRVSEQAETIHKDHLNRLTECQVLFVSDSSTGEIEPNNLFECFFKSHVAELFQRMVSAMKLNDTWMLTEVGDKTIEQLAQEVLFYKPTIIMTLGAGPTQFLLGTESRLKNIHGQFFQVEQGEYQGKLMPLFSPKLLSTAPNMKKTAWTDMQKVMTELKLL